MFMLVICHCRLDNGDSFSQAGDPTAVVTCSLFLLNISNTVRDRWAWASYQFQGIIWYEKVTVTKSFCQTVPAVGEEVEVSNPSGPVAKA